MDLGIGPWIEERLVIGISPAHPVWRPAVSANHLHDFSIAIGIADASAPDDDPVSDTCMHVASFNRSCLASFLPHDRRHVQPFPSRR